jgi:O-antigen biosynthesis protein WbqP
MKRLFDITISFIFLLILAAPLLFIAIAVLLTSKGGVFYWSDRVGINSSIYKMPKFRSMLMTTPEVATDMLEQPKVYLTPIGGFLRKYSLDELPQLLSVIKGDMALVGPRPALFNQNSLIELRKEKGIDQLLPGITGWAQVNGRDNLSIIGKVVLDEEYMIRQSFWFDVRILWETFLKVLKRDGVSH